MLNLLKRLLLLKEHNGICPACHNEFGVRHPIDKTKSGLRCPFCKRGLKNRYTKFYYAGIALITLPPLVLLIPVLLGLIIIPSFTFDFFLPGCAIFAITSLFYKKRHVYIVTTEGYMCPSCGYDAGPQKMQNCPECGEPY